LGGFDQVLVAAGREPILDTLGLDKAGIKTERGYITVRREAQNVSFSVYCSKMVQPGISVQNPSLK